MKSVISGFIPIIDSLPSAAVNNDPVIRISDPEGGASDIADLTAKSTDPVSKTLVPYCRIIPETWSISADLGWRDFET